MLRVSEDGNRQREGYLADYKQLRDSLFDLQKAADRIFDTISERTAQESQKLTDLSKRIQLAKWQVPRPKSGKLRVQDLGAASPIKLGARIDDIAQSKKAIAIKSPSKYPSHSKDEEDFKPLFGYNDSASGVGFPIAELSVNGGLNREFGADGTLELFQFFSETSFDFPHKEVPAKAAPIISYSQGNTSIENIFAPTNFTYKSLLKEVKADADSSTNTKEQSLPPPPPSLLDSLQFKSRNLPK